MKNRYGLTRLSSLLLTCIFAACLLLTLLAGAAGYRNISARLQTQYGARTALDYMTAKLRHYDGQGQIQLGSLDGTAALLLYEDIANVPYVTYLYVQNGYLYELLAAADDTVGIEDGLTVLPLESLSMQAPADNLLWLSCQVDGQTAESFLALSGAELEAAA